MRIILDQNELNEAISTVIAKRVNMNDRDISVRLRPHRGHEGFTAEVDVKDTPAATSKPKHGSTVPNLFPNLLKAS